MNINTKQIKAFVVSERLSEVLYLIALCTWIVFCVLRMSFFARPIYELDFDMHEVVRRCILLILALCELVQIYTGKYGRREAIILLPVMLMLWSLFLQASWDLLYCLLLIYTARTVKIQRVLAAAGISMFITAAFVVLCSQIGVIDDAILIQGSRARHCLGFLYCLYPAQFLFSAICLWCFLRKPCISALEAIMMVILNIAVYLATLSRLSCGLALVIIICAFIYGHSQKTRRVFEKAGRPLICAFALAAVFSIILALLYIPLHTLSPDVSVIINKLSASRIALSAQGINTYGISAFGQFIGWVGNSLDAFGNPDTSAPYNYVDNLFIKYLLQFGWVYLLAFVILLTRSSVYAYRTKNYLLEVILLIVAIHCMMDDLMGVLWFSPLLLLMTARMPQDTAKSSNTVDREQLTNAIDGKGQCQDEKRQDIDALRLPNQIAEESNKEDSDQK